ncbi:hypothetical protein ACOME3_001362 [Neoechinorhynchus agilis]
MVDTFGRLLYPDRFYKIIAEGGVDGSVRRDVWKLLFGYFHHELTSGEKLEASVIYEQSYEKLKNEWMQELKNNVELLGTIKELSTCRTELFIEKDILEATPSDNKASMISSKVLQLIIKDVPRTHMYDSNDLSAPFKLFNVLMTFAYQRTSVR